MLFPQVPLEEWAKLYGLEPFEEQCEACGRAQYTSIPWASGNWRGLKSTVCECGNGCDIGTAVNVKEGEVWKDLYIHTAENMDPCR